VIWALLISGAVALVVLSAGAAEALRRPDAHPPLPGAPNRISSRFGPRIDPVYGGREDHPGLDLRAVPGTPVFAPVDGRVIRVDLDGLGRGVVNGNAVMIQGEGLTWAFLHLTAAVVHREQQVQRGDLLGVTGATGKASGPHLHVQIWGPDGVNVDPEGVYPRGTFA
jgi:murein DD-endopeptidase MepM/ murein hydrolase activator NlpD